MTRCSSLLSQKKYSFHGLGVYALFGKVIDDFDVLSIEVSKMRKEAYITDPRFSEENPATGHRLEKMKNMGERKESGIEKIKN